MAINAVGETTKIDVSKATVLGGWRFSLVGPGGVVGNYDVATTEADGRVLATIPAPDSGGTGFTVAFGRLAADGSALGPVVMSAPFDIAPATQSIDVAASVSVTQSN